MKDYSVLDGMRKQTSEIIIQAFDKGYKQGYEDGRNTAQFCFNNEGYEEGLKDAWEAAKWIFNASVDDMMQTFGGVSLWVHYTASEAIAKIKEYEEKQRQIDDEMRVGDEVYILDKSQPYVVTCITESGFVAGISQRGKMVCEIPLSELHKTGRHFDEIEKVLKQMQEDKE